MFCDDMEATCKDCANVGECGVTKIGCAFYRSRENITEADRIRGMTDEELADWLLGASGCGPEWDHEYCRNRPHCGVNCWLDWLRKPVGKEDI